MELYHFTASRLLPRIKREGLTIGGIVSFKKNGAIKQVFDNKMWLTADSDFNQDWENISNDRLIPYSRTDWRITLKIPENAVQNLHRWSEYKDVVGAFSWDALSEGFDHSHWWIYDGHIPKTWFTAIDMNPARAEAAYFQSMQQGVELMNFGSTVIRRKHNA